MHNAFVESFNSRFREDLLNEHIFDNLAENRKIIENWRIDYNTQRPHSPLGGLASVVYENLNRATRTEPPELSSVGLDRNHIKRKKQECILHLNSPDQVAGSRL